MTIDEVSGSSTARLSKLWLLILVLRLFSVAAGCLFREVLAGTFKAGRVERVYYKAKTYINYLLLLVELFRVFELNEVCVRL